MGKEKKKLGMYGETPKVTFGQLSICEFTLPPGKDVWMQLEDEEGMQMPKAPLEKVLTDWFNKNF